MDLVINGLVVLDLFRSEETGPICSNSGILKESGCDAFSLITNLLPASYSWFGGGRVALISSTFLSLMGLFSSYLYASGLAAAILPISFKACMSASFEVRAD